MSREIMQQALDALTLAIVSHGRLLMSDPPQDAWKFYRVDQRCDDAIKALEAELAKPEPVGKIPTLAEMKKLLNGEPIELAKPEQEPVAWRNAAIRLGEDLYSVGPNGYYEMTAKQWLDWALSVVNTASPPRKKWVGLTGIEVRRLKDIHIPIYSIPILDDYLNFYRAIENELIDKNTTNQ